MSALHTPQTLLHIYWPDIRPVCLNPSVSFAVGKAMRNDFPELEYISQYFYEGEGMVEADGQRFNEEGYAFADQEFPEIFQFNWLEGDAETALREPYTVVLTESMARKYFGKQSALGKTIRLDNEWDLRVTGVIKDLPSNTHLAFTFLVSWETIRKDVEGQDFWSIWGGYLYVTLPERLSAERVEARFPAFIDKNWGRSLAGGGPAKLLLQPLKEIHFDQRYANQVSMPRSKESIYGLAAVAVFIVLTASINFINLATAQAARRSKEVGVRKTMGAYRNQLIGQVLGETTLQVCTAVVLATLAVWYFLPLAQPLFDIRIDPAQLSEPIVIGVITGIVLLTILLAGLYPAFIQSGFQPVKALKSQTAIRSAGGSMVRKGLLVLQFSITQLLIIGTFIIAGQMDFLINQNLGFDKEAVVSFDIGDESEALRQKLSDHPGVKQFSFSSAGPAYNTDFMPFSSPELGMTEVDVTEVKRVDEQYMPMFNIALLAGEPIKKTHGKDSIERVVVNQTLIRRLGIQDPAKALDKRFMMNDRPAVIGGVVWDFQSQSRHKPISACILAYDPDRFWQAHVKLRPQQMRETLTTIEEDWSALNPESLFKYEFLDEHIAALYTQEEKMYNAFRLFSVIAILIGCLGLYGLVSLIAVQRTKEVGIRKVLGASVASIILLFSRQFVWPMLIAFTIAAPLAWYIMNNWLEEFAYHIHITPGVFLISIIVTFAIATFTISFQSVKTALMNPVRSLRSE